VGKGTGASPARVAGGQLPRVSPSDVPLLLDVIDEIRARATAGGMTPHWPAARIGFMPSLQALAGRFTRATGIGVEVRTGAVPALAGEVEAALYWVVREALDNLERDGRATGVVITLTGNDADVELVIRDDGVGLVARQGPGARSSPHFGIRAITRCLEQIGGHVRITRAHPRGLTIRARAPARGSGGT
jgi:signal transduction histidine kinase